MELKKFKKLSELVAFADERRRNINPHDICEYPLGCLNDFLFGILPSELVVVGADTGIGKTYFSNELAITNAKAGRKTYLISLEGDRDEVINRWKYKLIANEFYKNKYYGKTISYALFVTNRLTEFESFNDEANAEILKLEDKLEIFDKSNEFTIDTLTNQIELIKHDAKLVVIDHLHYFSMFDGENENAQISMIMKKIKMLTEDYGIPVVIVSHLRKKTKERGFPDNEDFMGSSNIPKVSSTSIIITHLPTMHKDGLYATGVRVTKSRNGMKSNIAFKLMFDITTQKYNDNYELLRVADSGLVFDMKEIEIPTWARKLMRTKQGENYGLLGE